MHKIQSVENNTFNSIDGATALKLDEKFEVSDKVDESLISNLQTNYSPQSNENSIGDTNINNIPSGVSIENASYMENTPKSDIEEYSTSINHGLETNVNSEALNEEEHTPQLFEEESARELETRSNDSIYDHTDKLFEKDSNEDEDFEIPAFLRKQKF